MTLSRIKSPAAFWLARFFDEYFIMTVLIRFVFQSNPGVAGATGNMSLGPNFYSDHGTSNFVTDAKPRPSSSGQPNGNHGEFS